ncbi:hypothetical protein STEG23_018229 [Scotinomys teguina]
MTLKAQVEYPAHLYRPKKDFDITTAVVATIAVFTTAATAPGIAIDKSERYLEFAYRAIPVYLEFIRSIKQVIHHVSVDVDEGEYSSIAEDANLYIASRLIWFDQGRPPERSPDDPIPKITFKETGSDDSVSRTTIVRT